MNEPELRLLFEAGNLTSADIVRDVLSKNWVIQVHRKKSSPVLLDSQRASPRLFKTLDAAFRGAQAIGFRDVKVVG